MSEDSSPAGRKPRVKEDDITSVFWEADTPVLSTSDVADKLPITKRATFDRLSKLEETGTLGSELFPAGGSEVRVWWHTTVAGVPQAWSQSNPPSDKIGNEIVDSLDLPGDGGTLNNRRHAVNTVFKYLFTKGSATSSELRTVAWAANSNNTYSSQDSLWNNCISKALAQANSLFVFHKQDNAWELTTFGESVKYELGENSLWENWPKNKRSLRVAIFQIFWREFHRSDALKNTGSDESTRTAFFSSMEFRDIVRPLLFQLELQDEIWLGLTGTLYSHLRIEDDEETIRSLLNDQEAIQAELDIPTTWNYLEEGDSTGLQVTISKDIELDSSKMDIRQRSNGSGRERSPIQNPQWVIEVSGKFYEILILLKSSFDNTSEPSSN
ncbi:hypothetical protein PM030_05345 [Halorubrum ezzemoulense]|uniref:hypothetical protein n=1 Tax=Halorubrum ezzemoulense TaxID=337243 RepID=UPI00232E6F0C|nr:hypothetical protein [Halorubrum ezzemoulense]MDB2281294.1 hypothetical protein [Halorubrum ezzemoulense]